VRSRERGSRSPGRHSARISHISPGSGGPYGRPLRGLWVVRGSLSRWHSPQNALQEGERDRLHPLPVPGGIWPQEAIAFARNRWTASHSV